MKNILYGTFFLLATASLVSCSDSDPEFAVYPYKAYGVQLSDTEFKPVLIFYTSYGTLSPSNSSIVKGNAEVEVGSLYLGAGNFFETKVVYNTVGEMGGDYQMNAVSTDGDKASYIVRLSFDVALGEVDFRSFQYTDRQLKMTVPQPVENATSYGFLFASADEMDQDHGSWVMNEVLTVAQASSGADQEVVFSYDSSNMNVERCLVYPIAIRYSSNLTTLIRRGEPRLLVKGGTSFD